MKGLTDGMGGSVTPRDPVRLSTVPDGLEEIVKVYGGWPLTDSGEQDPEFFSREVSRFTLPYPMRLSWNPGITVKTTVAHRLVGASLIDALCEIYDTHGFRYLRKNDLDLFGGVYAARSKRGRPGQASTHAWAIAIDINPHRGPLGKPTDMPEFIVAAFERRGWEWGGRWNVRDGMHFQACTGY